MRKEFRFSLICLFTLVILFFSLTPQSIGSEVELAYGGQRLVGSVGWHNVGTELATVSADPMLETEVYPQLR